MNMGQSKRRQDAITSNLDSITKGYDSLISDAFENGEISELPSSLDKRLAVLEGLLAKKEGIDSESIKQFRLIYREVLSKIDKDRRLELERKFESMDGLCESEKREVMVNEVYGLFSSTEYKFAFQNYLQKVYDDAYQKTLPTVDLV
jgi:hypothetical protein